MEAPKIPSFIKTKYEFKRFNFEPRYYNADKEQLEFRKKGIEKELKGKNHTFDDNSIERSTRMKMSMESAWRNRRSNEYRKSNFRVAIIVVILVVILYVVKQNLGL